MKLSSALATAFLLAAPVGAASAQTASIPAEALDPSTIALITLIPGIDGAAALSGSGSDSNGSFGYALVSQRLEHNRVVEGDVGYASLIQDSFSRDSGIVSVNQDSGNINNQANVRVIAFAQGGADVNLPSVDLARGSYDNEIISSGVSHADSIVNSFNDTSGVVGVNQSSGNLNQQANVLVLAAGLRLSPEVALLDDHSLGDVIPTPSDSSDSGPRDPRSETIVDSFNNFSGIAQVSQSAGNENNISNVIGVSVNVLGSL